MDQIQEWETQSLIDKFVIKYINPFDTPEFSIDSDQIKFIKLKLDFFDKDKQPYDYGGQFLPQQQRRFKFTSPQNFPQGIPICLQSITSYRPQWFLLQKQYAQFGSRLNQNEVVYAKVEVLEIKEKILQQNTLDFHTKVLKDKLDKGLKQNKQGNNEQALDTITKAIGMIELMPKKQMKNYLISISLQTFEKFKEISSIKELGEAIRKGEETDVAIYKDLEGQLDDEMKKSREKFIDVLQKLMRTRAVILDQCSRYEESIYQSIQILQSIQGDRKSLYILIGKSYMQIGEMILSGYFYRLGIGENYFTIEEDEDFVQQKREFVNLQ